VRTPHPLKPTLRSSVQEGAAPAKGETPVFAGRRKGWATRGHAALIHDLGDGRYLTMGVETRLS